MLTSVPTKHGAGITIYGDFYDLSALHETIHKIAGQSWVDESFGDYMLGLAYDIRKAFEGQREKRTFVSTRWRRSRIERPENRDPMC